MLLSLIIIYYTEKKEVVMPVIKLCPSCFSIHDWSRPCLEKSIVKAKALRRHGKQLGFPSRTNHPQPSAALPTLEDYDKFSR